MARQYTRKQLKKPDEFITTSMRAWAYIQSRLPLVFTTLGVAVVLIAAVWVWTYFADRRGVAATEVYTRSVEINRQTVVPSTEKLPPSEDGIPRFQSRDAKLKAAEEELTKLVNKGGTLALQAQVMRAGVRYDGARYREAADDYQKVLPKIEDEVLRTRILENLGYCHEGLKEWDKALEYFRMLPRQGDSRDLGRYHEARILAKKGQVKQAADIFRELVNKASPASLQEHASDELAQLEAK